MRLSVEKITDIKKAYSLKLTAEDLLPPRDDADAEAPVAIVEQIAMDFNLSRIARRLLLEGEVEGSLRLQCGRCLETYTTRLKDSFLLSLTLLDGAQSDDQEVELDEERINSIEVVDGEIELLPLLQEQVLLMLPAYPVCREDCAGLCPYCGIDLNKGGCDCAPRPFNNRFGKLKDLKLNGSGPKKS